MELILVKTIEKQPKAEQMTHEDIKRLGKSKRSQRPLTQQN